MLKSIILAALGFIAANGREPINNGIDSVSMSVSGSETCRNETVPSTDECAEEEIGADSEWQGFNPSAFAFEDPIDEVGRVIGLLYHHNHRDHLHRYWHR